MHKTMIKPQDILVLLKLAIIGSEEWSYNKLSVELYMSSSEVHAACKRMLAANLAILKSDKIFPNIRNLEEFITHGLKYVFIPERGELTRGMPTSYAAEPLSHQIIADNEPVPVWPDANGKVRGMAYLPLYKSAPNAARDDGELYQLLSLIDAIRGGRARERNIALKLFKQKLAQYA